VRVAFTVGGLVALGAMAWEKPREAVAALIFLAIAGFVVWVFTR
jgi:hypothetical protein